MYCKRCGTPNAQEAKFCKLCGARMNQEPEKIRIVGNEKSRRQAGAEKKRPFMQRTETGEIIINIRKKTLRQVVLAAAVLIILLIAGSTLRRALYKVDIMDYVKLTCSGYDGHGTAQWSVPEIEKLAGKLAGNSRSQDSGTYQLQSLLDEGLQIGSSDNLSNGDEVEIRLTNIGKFQQTYSVKIKDDISKTVKVEGLTEVKKYNVLDDVSVTFSGVNTIGTAVLSLESSSDSPVFLNLENYDGSYYLYSGDVYLGVVTTEGNGTFVNGQEITIHVDWDEYGVGSILDNYGVDLSQTKDKTVTVSGLTELETAGLLDHAQIQTTGVEGNGQVACSWQKEAWQAGGITFTPDGEYTSRVYVSYTDADGNEQSDELYLSASQREGLSGGDTVTISVVDDYGDAIEGGRYANYGLALNNLSMEYTVNAEDLGRYITSGSQLTAEGILAVRDALVQRAQTDIMNGWGWYVHGSSDYICYDQEIVGTPVLDSAVLTCTDEGNNRFRLNLYVYAAVRDSELPDGQTLMLNYVYDYPLVKTDGTLSYVNDSVYVDGCTVCTNADGAAQSLFLQELTAQWQTDYSSWWENPSNAMYDLRALQQ